MLDIRFLSSKKIIELPSDRSRLGYIALLMEAKQQDPEGVFASMAVMRHAATAKWARDLVDWIDAKLIHAVASMCAKCLERFGPVPDGAFVIHDWHDYQEARDPSRTTVWRQGKGIKSGHERLADVSPSVSPDVSPSFPQMVPSRAPAGASASASDSESSPEGVQGEPDAANSLFLRMGRFPSEKTVEWLNELAEAHSEKRLIAAIDSTPLGRRNVRDYLVAIRDQLRAQDHAAEKAERADELRRNAAKRAPVKSLEEREAEYRAQKAIEAELMERSA